MTGRCSQRQDNGLQPHLVSAADTLKQNRALAQTSVGDGLLAASFFAGPRLPLFTLSPGSSGSTVRDDAPETVASKLSLAPVMLYL